MQYFSDRIYIKIQSSSRIFIIEIKEEVLFMKLQHLINYNY